MGTLDDNKLVSRSGAVPANSKTIYEFWKAAQENGSNWGLMDWDQVRFLMMLNLSEYSKPDYYRNIGFGLAGSGANWENINSIQTGTSKLYGDYNGSIDASYLGYESSNVILFGIENPYGWYFEMIQGIYFGKSNNSEQEGTEVFIYEGNRLPTENELQTQPEGKYRKISRITTSGYTSKMYLGQYFDLIPSEIDYNLIFWYDYYHVNSTGQILLWGGKGRTGTTSAIGIGFTDSSYSYNRSNIDTSTRLAYYGDIQFVPSSAIE